MGYVILAVIVVVFLIGFAVGRFREGIRRRELDAAFEAYKQTETAYNSAFYRWTRAIEEFAKEKGLPGLRVGAEAMREEFDEYRRP